MSEAGVMMRVPRIIIRTFVECPKSKRQYTNELR
jgi:hypothetical protein